MDPTKFTLTFPENCGLGLVSTTDEKSYTDVSRTIFCTECQSGYKKVFNANSIVTQCKVIPNCDPNRTAHWFNNCSKCLSTHAWHWSSTLGTLYDECVVKTIPNCEVVFNDVSAQVCKFCEKGYDLIDGKCEKYTVARCTSYLENSIPIEKVGGAGYDNFWHVAYK